MTREQLLQWDTESGSEEVGRRVLIADAEITTVTKRAVQDNEGNPDFDVSLTDETKATAEVTRLTPDHLHLQRSKIKPDHRLEAMWALTVRKLNPRKGIESKPITPRALDMAMDMTLSAAVRLEGEFGGGREMMAFQEANPYTTPPWANAAETEAANIRRKCFPLNLEPSNGDSFSDPQHLQTLEHRYDELYNPVRVSISVARKDAPEWEPGVCSLPVGLGGGGLLGTLDNAAEVVQQVVRDKGNRRQASHSGAKWLIAICAEPWLIWQIQEAFGEDQRLSTDELLSPIANISLTPFEKIWIICPASNTGETIHVIKASQEGYVTYTISNIGRD